MENKLRRFLILLAALMLTVSLLAVGTFATEADAPVCYEHGDVNGDGVTEVGDAIYTLYHSVYGDDYPVNQDCDFTGDEEVDLADALYLLWASMGDFFEDNPYTLKGTVHCYYEPVWQWNADATEASVTFNCGCGEANETYNGNNGLTLTTKDTVQASCVAAGSELREAKVTFDGQLYSSAKTVQIPATGHSISGTATCTEGVACANCDYEQEAPGHVMELDAKNSHAATCTASAVQAYKCANCDHTDSMTLAGETDHTWQYREGQDAAHANCEFVRTYECTSCGKVQEGTDESDLYIKHNITTTLTQDATCTTAGVKTETCACGLSEEKEIPVNPNAHAWDEGVTAEGITTYTCTRTGCGSIKTAVAVNAGEAVDKAVLAEVKELQLENDTAIQLDDATKAEIPEDAQVSVSVTTVAVEETGLTDEQKAQVGDNPVYNFEMTVNNDKVSNFAGTVTVTLPYTLQEGDDINSIDVWYISDDGSLQRMDATYSNGYVTFTTDHFSYYTVTRLTPTERCARYGHSMVEKTKAVTCTADGYEMKLCQRCGYVESKTEYTMTGHDYEETTNEATCTQAGTVVKDCRNCGHKVTGTLPATGHKLDVTKLLEATCTATGTRVQTCLNAGCDYSLTQTLAQTAHNFQVYQTKEADCVSGGYVISKCEGCDLEETTSETAALGHSYSTDSAQWTWNALHTEAAVSLTCAHDEAHTTTLTAVVTEAVTGATCEEAGSATYTATASFNKVTFTDTYTEQLPAAGHKPAAQWESDGSGHYHVCAVCEEAIAGADHIWGEGVITKEPTCVAAGKEAIICTVCGYRSEKSVPATGEHNFVNRICSECGYEDGSCDHVRVRRTEMDLSGYGLCDGAKGYRMTCECGEVSYLNWDLGCYFGEGEYENITLEDGTEAELWRNSCLKCGLTLESVATWVDDPDSCTRDEVDYEWLKMDGEVIAEGKCIYEEVSYHPMNPETATQVDLSQYGLCGASVEVGACYCGKIQRVNMPMTECYFEFLGWDEDTETYSYECSECGAIMEEYYGESDTSDPCEVVNDYGYNFYMDGEMIYSCQGSSLWYNHTYEHEYEMDGDSCEDGILRTGVCVDCGDVSKVYFTDHVTTAADIMDLTDFNICAGAARQSSCYCGKINEGWMYNPEGGYLCSWNWVDETTHVCNTCGATRIITEEVFDKQDDCYAWIETEEEFLDADGNHIVTLYNTGSGYHHANDAQRYELQGDDCEEDGVLVTHYCGDCGEVFGSWTEYHHIGMTVKTYDLSSLGMCASQAREMTCPCGEDTWLNVDDGRNFCEFSWSGSDETGYWQTCRKCQATMHVATRTLEKVDSCHEKRLYTYTFSHGDATPITVQREQIDTVHEAMVYSMHLLDGAQDCAGGYTTDRTCLTCGEVEENIYGVEYDHYEYCIDSKVLYDGDDICGTVAQETRACACAQIYRTSIRWYGGQCELWYDRWDGEQQMDVYVCRNCGLEQYETFTTTPIEGETCRQYMVRDEIYVKNGVELFRNTYKGDAWSHDQLYTYTLLGDTCDDGYTVSCYCADCGDGWEDTGVQTGCYSRPVERTLVYDGDGICGPIYIRTNSCACGAESNRYLVNDCDMMHYGWNQELQASIYRCQVCGLEERENNESERIPGTCKINTHKESTYVLNGEVIATAELNYESTSHESYVTYNLMGDSCEDGYTMTRRCIYCDWSNEEDGIYYSHDLRTTARYELDQYGMCGGWLEEGSCACGQYQTFWDNFDCDWDYSVWNEQLGMNVRTCRDCGTRFATGETANKDPNSCYYIGSYNLYILGEDDSILQTVSVPIKREEHTDIAIAMVLRNPDGDCEDGVDVTLQCVDCGNITTDGAEYCREWRTVYLDLADYGACGGEFNVFECACGQIGYSSYSYDCANMDFEGDYQEIDGIGHHYNTHSCGDCGLTIAEDYYTVHREGTCLADTYRTMTVRVGDLNETYQTQQVGEDHDMLPTYTLLEGSQTCEDGISRYDVCRRCGVSYHQYDTNGHNVNLVEEIDLAQYGAVCGATLNHYRCACGYEERYDLAGDTLCMMDRKNIDNDWIDGTVLDETGSETTEGYWYLGSDSYTFICAVTDPMCGFGIRMSECWLKEGCEAVEYQIWQLGYDAATDTYQYEIKLPTGVRHAYHEYESVYTEDPLSDGGRVLKWTRTCDCGSTFVSQTYYTAANVEYRSVSSWVNTLEDGYPKERTYIREYEELWEGYYLETLARNEKILADGSLWWEQETREYIFDGDCRYIRYGSNSDGQTWEYEESAHIQRWYDETLKAPTCTQFGLRNEKCECPICGTIYVDRDYEVNPTAHYWYGNSDRDCYICSYCGLESATGASGEIVLEDMTEDYGNGTNTVIGYWVRENVKYTVAFSVILEDMEGDNERFLNVGWALWSVDENGVNALVFDTANAQTEAEAAIAAEGYTGSYAIRVTMVPVSAGNDLDYAITFDSQTAA